MSDDSKKTKTVRLFCIDMEENINWPTATFVLVIIFWWLLGIAVAKGFLPTLCAAVFPPYAMYLPVSWFYQNIMVGWT